MIRLDIKTTNFNASDERFLKLTFPDELQRCKDEEKQECQVQRDNFHELQRVKVGVLGLKSYSFTFRRAA